MRIVEHFTEHCVSNTLTGSKTFIWESCVDSLLSEKNSCAFLKNGTIRFQFKSRQIHTTAKALEYVSQK
jgi:hypothetical protein